MTDQYMGEKEIPLKFLGTAFQGLELVVTYNHFRLRQSNRRKVSKHV